MKQSDLDDEKWDNRELGATEEFVKRADPEFEKALDEDSISYKEYTVSDSNDIASVVQSAVSECDVLYIPTDNTMAGNTESINNIALPAGVPIIAGEEGICSGCGVATLSISYYDLGYKTGEMAVSILQDGKDIFV